MKAQLQHKEKSGIYCIRNKITNKVYIGKSVDVYRRIQAHKSSLNRKSKDENRYLINSWHKHGESNFEYFVIEYAEYDDLSKRELYWMKCFNSLDRKHGYNLRPDSEGGLMPAQETRDLLSESGKRRFSDPKEREKVSKFFKKFWEDNPEKKEVMKRKLSKSKEKYIFHQYDSSGTLLNTYPSMKDILEKNPTFTASSIYNACNGYKPHYRQFIWKKELKI